MKLTVKTKDLKQVLELHKKLKPKNTFILNGIQLKAITAPEYANCWLELYSTDLDYSIKSTIEANDVIDGEVLILIKNLDQIVKNTKSETLTLELIDNKLKIGPISLNTLKLEEFPTWPEVSGQEIELNQTNFFKALEQLQDCVGQDETRVIMTGYCLNTKENEIVATDSYKLGVVKQQFNNEITTKSKDWDKDFTKRIEKTSGNLVIPGRVYELLKKVKSSTLKLTVQKEQIKFTLDNVELVTRPLTGRYPNYQVILEGLSSNYEVEFDSQEMIDKLLYVQKTLIGREPIPVKLRFNSDSIEVSCEVKAIGSYNEMIPAVANIKEPLQMAFNPIFLIGILKQLPDRVKISIKDELRPLIIKQDEGLKYILMPVRIET